MEAKATVTTTSDQQWTLVPTDYDLETVGIGKVFVCPSSSSPSPGKNDVGACTEETEETDGAKCSSISSTTQFFTGEMVGTIKSRPEDFIVREILRESDFFETTNTCIHHAGDSVDKGADDRKRRKTKKFKKVAHLTDTTTLPPSTTVNDDDDCNNKKTQEVKEDNNGGDGDNCVGNSYEKLSIEGKNDHVIKVNSPTEVIQKILAECISNNAEENSDHIASDTTYYDQIRNFHDEALDDIQRIANVQQKGDISNNNVEVDNTTCVSAFEDKMAGPKNDRHVVIPPINDDTIISLDISSLPPSSPHISIFSTFSREFHKNRGTFHKALKIIFPLLSSSTLQHDDNSNKNDNRVNCNIANPNSNTSNANKEEEQSPATKMKKSTKKNLSGKLCDIKIMKDTSLYALIPFLSHPQNDLVELYKFRNLGCVHVSTGGKRKHPKMRGRNKKRRKVREKGSFSNIEESQQRMNEGEKKSNGDNQNEDNDHAKSAPSDPTQVFLRLKPNLSKEKRRDVHHIIGKTSYHNLGTNTISDFTFLDESGSEQKCTAIIVYWTDKAQLRAKNKLNNSGAGKARNQLMSTLCVLKKSNVEHLAAIKHLALALKCNQRNIGFAGMKDQRGITSQFLTIRNVSHVKLQKANYYLKPRSIEIGNFESVQEFLQPGMLLGNEFEIVVRDIKRVEIRKDAEGQERLIPHFPEATIDIMVDNIRQNGFVNFFGEQRVGHAGPNDEIGVRAFDIGRAMLKRDFTEAIDLLMTGRNKLLNGEYAEGLSMRRVRQLWKESGRDPAICLSSFPKDKNKMIRERTVLEGLKRYGKPLEALQCLAYSVRTFWINSYQSYVWNTMATRRLKLGNQPLLGDLYIDDSVEVDKVKIVTDTSSVKMTQIVLPLPGYNVKYPTNSIGKVYKDFLEKEEGVTFLQKEDGAKISEESTAKGSYRRLIVIPHFIDWKPVEQEGVAGNVKAAKFTFSLRAGSYATMLLRELMKSQVARN